MDLYQSMSRNIVKRMAFGLAILTAVNIFLPSSVLADHHASAANPIMANFLAADENGDSGLDRKEFVKFVAANAKADIGPFTMIHSNNMHDRAFSRMDNNEDGVVEISELRGRRR